MLRAALIASVVLAAAAPAAAQDKAAAEALFQDGRRLAAQGKHAEACDKFAASDKLDPSVGARIQLGQCNEAQGKTASAWASFKAAQNLAARLGDSRRAEVAKKEAARLEPKLTYVVIRAAGPSGGLTVRFDGAEKPTALLGQRFPVDPGSHSVAASADGKKGWAKTVDVSEPGAVVEIEIPALEALAGPPDGAPADNRPPDGHPETTPVEPGAEPPSRTRARIGYGVGAAGIALTATGAVFGALAKSKYDSRTDGGECDPNNVCSDAGLAIIDSAKSRALIATILVPAGLVAAGVGVYLILSAPDQSEGVSVGPMVDRDRVGLAVGGRF